MSLASRERRVGLHLPVEVRGSDASGATFVEMTKSLNVSGGGLAFESDKSLVVGSSLTLAIQVPPALQAHFKGRAVYRVRAVVCRVEHFEGQKHSRVGVRFLGETT